MYNGRLKSTGPVLSGVSGCDNESLDQKEAALSMEADVINRIVALNRGITDFWSRSDGWAPAAAAGLLNRARLDWQVSLSKTLRLWMSEPARALSPGELILAWANLGSLIEGTIKLLLVIYYEDYKTDIENLKSANAYNRSTQVAHNPVGLTLETLRKFCKTSDLLGSDSDRLVELVQQRRNAIHAFKDRPIGDSVEFQDAVRSYLRLLQEVNSRLPYPSDVYEPREY